MLASGGSIKQGFGAARLLTNIEYQPVFQQSDLLVRDGADPDESFLALLPMPEVNMSNPLHTHNEAIQIIRNSNVGKAVVISGNNSVITRQSDE